MIHEKGTIPIVVYIDGQRNDTGKRKYELVSSHETFTFDEAYNLTIRLGWESEEAEKVAITDPETFKNYIDSFDGDWTLWVNDTRFEDLPWY